MLDSLTSWHSWNSSPKIIGRCRDTRYLILYTRYVFWSGQKCRPVLRGMDYKMAEKKSTTITQLQRLHRTIQGIQLRKTVQSNLNVVLGIVCDNNTFQNNLNIVHGVLCDNTIKYSGCVGLGSKTIYFFSLRPDVSMKSRVVATPAGRQLC